jgi:hypothetical protein
VTRVSAVGDAISDDAVRAVKEELEFLRACDTTPHALRFALRREKEATTSQLDLPAAAERFHTNDIGHVRLVVPGANHRKTARASEGSPADKHLGERRGGLRPRDAGRFLGRRDGQYRKARRVVQRRLRGHGGPGMALRRANIYLANGENHEFRLDADE